VSQDVEEQPLQGMNSQDRAVSAEEGIDREAPNAAPSLRAQLAFAFASVVWASSTYVVRLLTTSSYCEIGFERTVFPVVLFCPLFLRRADCSLRQRDVNNPRLVRLLRV
jgi:hypothetical protein